MNKKITSIKILSLLVAFLGVMNFGFGQIYLHDFGTTTISAHPYTVAPDIFDSNLSDSSWSNSIGTWTSYAGSSGQAISLSNSSGTPSIILTFVVASGYQLDITSFNFWRQRSSTGAQNWSMTINGISVGSGTVPTTRSTIGNTLVSNTVSGLTGTITVQISLSGASGNGTFRMDDFTLNGSVYCTDAVDYENIQFPNTSPQNITVGNSFDVYAQVYEPSVTDVPNSQGSGVSSWIGYNTTNNNPDGGAGWTWIPATYNDIGGNNDEYKAEIGLGLSVGTYYYASRFQLNGCNFTYGGSGGIWDNDSVQLIVEDDTLDFYNLQFPEVGSITTGNVFDVFGQVYEAGLTPGVGQAPGISAWVGYNTTNTDPSTWTNWVAAGYNPSCSNCNSDQNDEYFVNIGSIIPSAGTYYYATRFKLNSGSYTYGGILSDGSAGGQWDGSTYISGVLTVTPEPCNDLIISEYVEGSSNNKYLEIYNPTGSTIDLSNYSLQLYSNGSSTLTTTSALSGTIASGATIVYQDANATIYSGSTTILTPNPVNFNGNDAVALVHLGSIIDVIGQIGFNPGSEWTGGSASTVDRTLVRKSNIQYGDYNGLDTFDPNLEWNVFPINDVSDLGYHFSDCIPSNELQLQLPIGLNVSCGDSYTFSTTTINSNNDVVLRIQNIGSLPLNISNLSFAAGTHYTLVSPPATPFSIAGSSYQDITIRFNPTTIGLQLDTLTIISDDSSEGSCSIDFSGISESNCSTTTVTLAAQDFESAVSDTWFPNANHNGTLFPNNWGINTMLQFPDMTSSIASAQSGNNFWGITDLERFGHINQTHQLSFSYNGLNVYDNAQLSFYYYTIGVDASDSFEYELFYDSISQGIIDISADNDAWTQVLINVPNTVNQLDIIFYADLDAQYDLAGLDNIELTSTTINTTTWTSSGWSDGDPDINTVAILDYDFNTDIGINGETSFSACSLTVNNGFTLNIADGNFVEVENDLTVNGNIIVQPKGSFVQNNDDSVVGGAVLSDKTKIVVNKNTASPANNWYEYTYWSSPVEGETITDGLFESTTNRRFIFNAQNYLDHCAESNNDNNCIPGFQDNIDDDGNDWQWVNGTTVMKPGVGYASTHDAIIFGSTPGCPGTSCSIEYTFNGPFNNGIITVPVYRNDSEFNDNNSNLIGNPYPSAISADDFFDLNVHNSSSNPNGTLEGVIYLWSQNTQPSATANGNQGLNFSELDYAVINGIDGTAGGDKVIPNRFIPSGQGFFVSVSDLATVIDAPLSPDPFVKTADVIFNNALRVTGNNNQFFKASNSKHSKSNEDYNKLWVNLTSDIGVFNQILVGYVNGATNDFDGMYYDVPRNLTAKTASALYSLISDNQSKYVIQGKDPNSLNLGEVVPLGFYTAITGATLYKLSIAQFKGDFFNSNTVYLKDNLMNTVHNLSESDYTFTSEIGEFNNRFEIVFQSEILSNIEAQLNSNKLTVIELSDGRVEFKTNSNLIIKTVKIFDVLGRTLYQLKGSNSSEIYNLSNLSQSTYIAKVELSNGQIVTKKALKRI